MRARDVNRRIERLALTHEIVLADRELDDEMRFHLAMKARSVLDHFANGAGANLQETLRPDFGEVNHGHAPIN